MNNWADMASISVAYDVDIDCGSVPLRVFQMRLV
jgi:hypothetical protein